MLNRLTDALNFQTEALSLRSERQRLLASNIANADTPGYQARDMNFAQALREATGASAMSGAMTATQAGHISPAAGARSDSQKLYSTAAQTNLDSNTVDMDRERGAFMDNALKYDATLRFINANVRMTLDAMKSANQA
jgi:flagellar basal-body rod protein FlgB